MMRITYACLLCMLWLSAPAFAAGNEDRNLAVNQVNMVSDKRIALVIGNSAYTNSPLKNPVNDAKDIAAKLRGLGFDVIERNNLKKEQIGGTLREFRSKLTPGAVALVFYAGHGLQIKGINYLPAVDADINSEEDVPNQSIAVNQIMDVLDEAKTRLNLVFLDACRNNPYARSFRSADQGLARISAPSGTLISYATRPGSVAADGEGRNGLYTSKLLAQMDSNVQIELALKQVVTAVKVASQGKQEPWMEGSIEGDFCFGGCTANGGGAQVASLVPAPAPVHVKSSEEIEQETWESARDSASIGAVQEYLKQYPKGRFVGQARVLIATLKTAPAKPAESISPSSREDSQTALWSEVQKGGSVDDYNAYLAQYPKGRYVALARSRIKKLQEEAAAEASRKEQDAWEAADKSGSEDGYQGYLKDWPDGRYAKLAQVRIRKLQADLAAHQEQELWQQAQAGKNAQTVQSYLDKYPNGSHVAAAREKLEAIRKAEADRNVANEILEQAKKGGSAKLEKLKELARQGNADAQGNLARIYFNGWGIKKDYAEGLIWAHKAAEQGNSDGQNVLGFSLINGFGVEKDEAEGVKWYRKSAEQGNARAQISLGSMYANGLGVAKDYDEAVKWIRKAVEQGEASGQFSLGLMYANGHGVAKDEVEAVKWYRKAAEQGEANGQGNLGWMYANGKGVAKDQVEAVKWYRKAAEQGNAFGQTNLAIAYVTGQGVAKDQEEAVKWYRKAAEQGNALAQNNLGWAYKNGQGVEKDEAEAVKWFRKSAEQGNALGQTNLAIAYVTGQGIEKDQEEAVKWYRKAAEQGNALAQNNLGVAYDNGQGVAQDKAEAIKWYRKAAEQGQVNAINNLKRF